MIPFKLFWTKLFPLPSLLKECFIFSHSLLPLLLLTTETWQNRMKGCSPSCCFIDKHTQPHSSPSSCFLNRGSPSCRREDFLKKKIWIQVSLEFLRLFFHCCNSRRYVCSQDRVSHVKYTWSDSLAYHHSLPTTCLQSLIAFNIEWSNSQMMDLIVGGKGGCETGVIRIREWMCSSNLEQKQSQDSSLQILNRKRENLTGNRTT